MSTQVAVNSIQALKDFRAVLALYGEDALAALGAVEAEVRRTTRWLQEERPLYWQDQIKRRQQAVASAKAEVFRRQLGKTPEHHPAMTEQKEILRRAEASLQEAEQRLILVRKWQPKFQHAVLEYHASIRRIKTLAGGDVLRAIDLLGRIIDSLEAYLHVSPPSGAGTSTKAPSEFESIATTALDQEPPAEADAAPEDPHPGPLPGEREEDSSTVDPNSSP